MKLTKAALQRVKKRAKLAMADHNKWMQFNISPEVVIAMIEELESRK